MPFLHALSRPIRALLAGPMDKTTVEEARTGLRQVLFRQGQLKKGIDESKAAMRTMLGTFVERLDGDHLTVLGLSLPVVRELAQDMGLFWPDLWSSRG